MGVAREGLRPSLPLEALIEEQKRYIAYYAVCGDTAEAANTAGVSLSWVEEQERQPVFRTLKQAAQDDPIEFAQQLLIDALPHPEMMLKELANDDDPRIRAAALKLLTRVPGSPVTL